MDIKLYKVYFEFLKLSLKHISKEPIRKLNNKVNLCNKSVITYKLKSSYDCKQYFKIYTFQDTVPMVNIV